MLNYKNVCVNPSWWSDVTVLASTSIWEQRPREQEQEAPAHTVCPEDLASRETVPQPPHVHLTHLSLLNSFTWPSFIYKVCYCLWSTNKQTKPIWCNPCPHQWARCAVVEQALCHDVLIGCFVFLSSHWMSVLKWSVCSNVSLAVGPAVF